MAMLASLWDCGTSTPSSHHADASTSRDAGRDGGGRDAARDTHAAPKDTGADTANADAGAPADAGPGFDAPTGACGSGRAMRGLTHRSVVVEGVTRTYEVYIPASADPTTPIPFVFVFHGYMMSGDEMRNITQYTAIADAEGIGIAFPDGEGGANSLHAPWNVDDPGQTVCGAGDYVTSDGDDMGFVDAMKADISAGQCLDKAHLFSTGFSMGGYFTHHIACYRSDMRACAPHSGGTLANLSACTTGHMPMIIFHGKGDTVIDDACDDPTIPPDVGFPASAKLWAAKNGCQSTFTTIPTDGDAGHGDAGAGQCYLYDGCPADGQVEVCTFDAMPHCWAGGFAGDAGDINACPAYAHATELQWAFFKKYAW
jgi:polyhydroxybutyrate depolymerase